MASTREVKGLTGKAEEQAGNPQGLAERVRHYFTELQFEWKKISFPSRKELQKSTVVVFVFTLLVMAIITLFDILVGFVFSTFILPPA